jgi:hypothetical protein
MKTAFKGFLTGAALFLLLILYASVLESCTKNQRVKRFGGTAAIELPVHQKLVHVTWKDENIWYLTRPMTPKDSAETYTFQEKSNFGLIEGTYKIKETK